MDFVKASCVRCASLLGPRNSYATMRTYCWSSREIALSASRSSTAESEPMVTGAPPGLGTMAARRSSSERSRAPFALTVTGISSPPISSSWRPTGPRTSRETAREESAAVTP